MPLAKVRKIFLGIIVLFIAVSLTVGVYVVRTQRTENRSKAGGLIQPTVSSALELPLVEFGTIEKITGVGYRPQKIIAKKTTSVLGETTETTPSATPVCPKTASGDSMCPQWSPVPPDFCKGGIITQGKIDTCGCIGPPDCSYPITSPPPGCTYQEVGSELGIVCQTPTATITSFPTPTKPPPQPARYIFKTFDNRVYVLTQPTFNCPPNVQCAQVMPPEINFDQYLNTPIMIEGILKRSKCTYAPEVTDYRCDVLQNSPDQNYPFWPISLPKDGIFEARTVHTAQPLQKDQLPSQPISGILSISKDKYANENVYMLPDYNKCAPPVCGPKFVRSATVNLAALLNTVVQVDGRFYYVDGAVFIDVTSVNTSSPTPQPTCIPFPKECLNPPPRDPNAELGFCDAVQQDLQFSQVGGSTSKYCPPPCTPLGEGILSCMRGGKSLDDCTATMGAPLLPWCKPTPTPIVEPECRVKPEGASCCASNCPPGATCIQSCAEGTCKDRVCMPNKPEQYCQGKSDGTYCSPQGYCQNQKCVPVPPRCYFQQVQCFKAPCDPVLLCPTPTPSPTPTPTQDNCNNQPEGSSCIISDCPVCIPNSGPCSLRPCRLTQGTCRTGICQSNPIINNPATTLALVPNNITYTIGDEFDQNIVIDTHGNRITAAEIHVSFDSTKVEALSIINSGLLPNTLTSGSIDRGAANIVLGASNIKNPYIGAGTIATIHFKTLQNTETPTYIKFAPSTMIGALELGSINALSGTTPATIFIASKNNLLCNGRPNGSQCWISGNCPPPPPCTGPGPCAVPACLTSPGICQNGTCIPGKPTNSCSGAPNGVSCTLSVCNHPILFGGFGDFLPKQCKELPGICQNNTCIEPPKPTLASCKQGDINRDGTVDTQDLGYLLVNFLKHVPELNIPTVDINGDGFVDLSDYSLFAKDFGTSTGSCI